MTNKATAGLHHSGNSVGHLGLITDKTVTMMRGRVCRQATVTDYILLAVFVILLLVFIQRRGYLSQADSKLEVARGHKDGEVEHMDQGLPNFKTHPNAILNLVDDRIKKIEDSREKECLKAQYSVNTKVSIIIQFFDYQFYDVKTTIGSVLFHSPKELIKEIILVDDGTSLDYIKEDAKSYVTSIAKATMIELPNRYNNGKALMHAVEVAKGDVLVFLDSSVIVNKGWLEPLLAVIKQDSHIIAVPHYDNINDPVSYDYKSTASHTVAEFSWSLSVRMSQQTEFHDILSPINSPMLRGNAFAVDRSFFQSLAGFDEDIEEVSAQYVELSLRSWLCGGLIKVVPCSKVGVLSLDHAVKVTSGPSIRRIVELWLGDKASYVYRNSKVSNETDIKEKEEIKIRRGTLDTLKCKSFDWYLQNIGKNVYVPSSDAKVYGFLKCKTGRCARVGSDLRIDLGQCKADSYNLKNSEMIMEYTEKKQVKYQGRCLGVLGSAYVLVEDCRENDTKQQYNIINGKLVNEWSSYCFMHVTDPDKNVTKGRQIMMAQDCGQDSTGEFSTWEFIDP